MAKKKDRKKKDKKIAAKAKTKEKAKEKKLKLKEKALKEKTKVKKAKTKAKKAGTATGSETSKGEKGTAVAVPGKDKTPGATSILVNARTAASRIKSFSSIEEIKDFIKGDVRVTVKEAATSRIAMLSGK